MMALDLHSAGTPSLPGFTAHLMITPSTYRPILKQAIVDAAVAAGISIDGYGHHAGKSVIHFVESPLDMERKAPDHLMTILRLPPETAPDDLTLALASGLLSALSQTPPDACVIDVSALREGDTLEVFPGVTIVLPPRPAPGRISPAGRALGLFRNGAARPGEAVEWPMDLFAIDPAAAVSGVPGALSLPGRARCLMWGPYIQLPPGVWRATIRFTVDEPASHHHFRFEWGGADFTQLAFRPGKSGVYQAELTQSWAWPETVELRLIMPSSALNGLLEIESINVEMAAPVGAEILGYSPL